MIMDDSLNAYLTKDFIRLVRYEDAPSPTETPTYKYPRPTTSQVIVKNLRTEEPRQMRVPIPPTTHTTAEENIYTAVITQEYRRAGEMTISVPKHVTEVRDLRNMLEVTSDYLKLYVYGFSTPDDFAGTAGFVPLDFDAGVYSSDSQGIPIAFPWSIDDPHLSEYSSGANFVPHHSMARELFSRYRDILTFKGWRGCVSNIEEDGDMLRVTYTGELAGLSNIFIEPYETPALDVFGFGCWLTDKHNAQVSKRYKMYYSMASDCPYGDQVVRSSEGMSSIYDGLQKITRLGNLEPLIMYSGTNRYLVIRQQPMVIDATLTHMDILSASQGVNYDERFRKVILLGETPETGTQPRGTYTQSDPDIAYKAKENMTLVDDYDAITPSYLATKAQERYEQQMVDSQSISIKLTAEAGKKVKLGGLYHIVYANAGIDGTYRLIKRTIDIFNPSENTHTFGAVNMLSQSDGVDGRYLSQDTIDGLY